MAQSAINDYPKSERQKFKGIYALAYISWLIESGAVQEIGPDAFALLTAIVSREDRTRYQYAPNYFNTQLASECGIGSEPALIRARKRAIEAGLLIYIPGAKRRPGRYFAFGFPNDSLVNAESFPNDSLGKAEGIRRESVGKTAPSSPNPIPNPIPTHTHTNGQEEKKRTRRMPEASPALQPHWQRWCEFRFSVDGREIDPIRAEAVLMALGRSGDDKAIRDIDFSIRKGARSILDSDHDFEKTGRQTENKKPVWMQEQPPPKRSRPVWMRSEQPTEAPEPPIET